jgi:hypothetical protein
MASIDVGIHPDAGQITNRRFTGKGDDFSTLELGAGGNDKVVVFVSTRPVLDALQAALDEIRADMDAAAQGQYEAELDKPGHVPGKYVPSDEVPTEMADWPAGPPGEAAEVFGK